jgi:NTP pyrophosphatase (non-canonical NTP hydrolase)
MTDTTPALLTILNPESTVPQREEAADLILAAHPERPRASLVTLLAAEAMEARAALKRLQRRLEALEEAQAKLLLESCASCFWRDGEMCLKFSEPHERLGYCRVGYKPSPERPGVGRGWPLQIEGSYSA